MGDTSRSGKDKPRKDLAELATILDDARDRLGYSVYDIHMETGVTRGHWYRIQRQEIDRPGIPILTALAELLELDANLLHELAGHPPVGQALRRAEERQQTEPPPHES